MTTRQSLTELDQEYSGSPGKVRQALEDWIKDDFSTFFAAGGEYLPVAGEGPFAGLVLRTMRDAGPDITTMLLKPDLLTMEQARVVFTRLARVDAGYPVQLLTAIRSEAGPTVSDPKVGEVLRAIEILEGNVDPGMLSQAVRGLLTHTNARLRSKAALLTIRSGREGGPDAPSLQDADARVRANAVEAFWGDRSAEAIQIFLEAAQDPHHRVVGNGIRGLYEAGVPASLWKTQALLRHSDAQRQMTGFWLAGTTGDARFLPTLENMLPQATGKGRGQLLRAIHSVKERQAKLEQGPATQLELLSAARWAGGRVRCRIRASDLEGEAQAAIRATDVQVFDGGIRVDAIRWNFVGSAEEAHVVLLLPRRVGMDDPFALRMIEAAEAAIAAKRGDDAWSVAFYQPHWGEAEIPAPGPGALTYSRSAATLKADALRSGKHVSEGLHEALYQALRAFPAEARHRHLVLLRDPSLPPLPLDLEGWLLRAKDWNLHLYVLCARETTAEEFGFWHRACQDTGGIALPCPLDGELPPTLAKLAAAVAGSYELNYALGRVSPQAAGAAFPVEIQVLAESGHGRLAIPVAAQFRLPS